MGQKVIEERGLKRLSYGLIVLTLALLTAALSGVAYLSLQSFERVLQPRLEAKAGVVASVIGSEIDRALAAGIPLEELRGFEPFAAAILEDHPEILKIELRDSSGRTLFVSSEQGVPAEASWNETVAVGSPSAEAGRLAVAVAPGYVTDRLREIQAEILVILLVALFLTFEVLLVVVAMFVTEPVRRLSHLMAEGERGVFRHLVPGETRDEIGRFAAAFNRMVRREQERFAALEEAFSRLRPTAPPELSALMQDLGERLRPEARPAAATEGSIADVRMPLFLFFFATELSRSFLPIFARDLYEPLPGLSYEITIALPIALYLFLVAILTPMAGALAGRFGSRRLFLLGLVPTGVGLLMTALANDIAMLILWRAVNAVGFALTTIAALDYIARAAGRNRRAEGMAIYTAAFVTAGLCGTSIGGILADRLGYHATFLVAAAVTLLSAFMLVINLRDRGTSAMGGGVRLRLADFGTVLANPRFQLLILIAAIPTQLLTTGYLFYATPMLLDSVGYSTSVIGQTMMVYFVVMILMGVPMARLADRVGRYRLFAGGGLLLAGMAAILPSALEGSAHFALWVALSMGLVGVAHALCIPSQGAILLQEADRVGGDRRTAAISAYRVLERIGSVLGPILAASLAALYGYAWTIGLLGLYVLACGLLFTAISLLRARGGASAVN
ncbi:MFS transporter [Aquibaculum sediminis]|uniref:MFS transporter n=1 Tax=Aquibaculum sediminis TaxID=3231907 RepID=UPI00345309A1